jgi:hypothetical protein
MRNETIHVTAVRGSDVYGHGATTCDPAGCAGREGLYPLVDASEVEEGHVYEIDAAGNVVAEVQR